MKLETLDWGGTGPAVVFLAGLGNTAHIFDEFAPQFADSFHVVGITRRGFGASAGSPPPTDLDTLVADIRAVLDSLGLRSVNLIGHSIAAEEMIRFAETDPSRCASLVYIDGAYDRTNKATLDASPAMPAPPPMVPRDARSLASRRAYGTRVLGVEEPESEVRATARFDDMGSYVGEVTDQAAKANVTGAARAPRYDRVRCPALAIYAVPQSPEDAVPYYTELNPEGRADAAALVGFVTSLIASSRYEFERFSQNKVVEINGNHFLFLQHPEAVAEAIRSFLSVLRGSAAP